MSTSYHTIEGKGQTGISRTLAAAPPILVAHEQALLELWSDARGVSLIGVDTESNSAHADYNPV